MGAKDDFDDLSKKGQTGRVLKNTKQVQAILEGASSEVVRRIQLRAMQTLPSATPVDTGHARSAWTPNVGSPVVDRLDRPSDAKAARGAASGRAAANRAKAEGIARSYLLRQGKVFISNNVPYVVFLDQGSSAQAPANFVERALTAAILSVGTR